MERKQRGQAAVEFALLLPVLALLALGLVDLGRAFYFQETITNAAREGARYGALTKDVTTGQIQAAALGEVGSLSGVSATAWLKEDAVIMGKYVEVKTDYNFTLITPLVQNVVGVSSIPLTATAKQPRANGFTN